LPQQFDLVENLDPDGRGRYPFLIVLQHDRVSSTTSVVVAPLVEATPALAHTRLHPQVVIAGRQYFVFIEDLAAIPKRILGRVVDSAEPNRYEIVAALDLLFTGI
jgi:toxin CcdB